MTASRSESTENRAAAPGRLPRTRGRLAAVAAGLALCFSLPPWGFWPLAIVAIAGLDQLLANRSAASRFRRAALFGVAWLLPSTLWMWDFTKPGWFASTALMSAMVGAAGALTPGRGPGRRLALPGAITVAEFVRWSVPFGGVPLSAIPLSQASSPLAPLTRIGGGPLLVFTVAALGVGLSMLADGARARSLRAVPAAALSLALAPAVLGLAAAALVPRSATTNPVRVAVVQGGGEQRTRAVTSDANAVFERHLAASRTIAEKVDLVVWPENVVSIDQPLARSPEGRKLVELSERLDAPIVVGVVETVSDDEFTNYSAVVSGNLIGDRYDKVQRVPFGEYVPFRDLTDALSGGAASRFIPRDARPGTGPATIDTPVGRLGVVISWEVFFERRARDAIGNGGTVLLNPTNGSSYWLTIVQSQQVASSQLRAIETDRWVVQAAPTGFSALVDPNGTVTQRSAISEQAVLVGTVSRRAGLSPATRLGPWPALGLALVAVILGRARRRTPEPTSLPPESDDPVRSESAAEPDRAARR